MAEPRRTSTRRAVLSYDQYKDLYKTAGIELPDLLVKDYQGIFQDFVFLADSTDGLDDQITINSFNIATNATNISTNSTNISNNATDISTNTTNIGTNATNIGNNTAAIGTNADNLTDHENETSAHGVTGDNVGTEDYCTAVIGGVVLLMASVNNAIDSTETIALADIAAAPAAYSQAHTDTLVAMANDTKAKHNQLVADLNLAIAQINDLIAKSKSARQMVV